MPKPRTKFSADKVMKALLQSLAKTCWTELSHEKIAKAAKVSLAQLTSQYPEKNDLARGLVAYISQLIIQDYGQPDLKQSAPDRLFDVLMTRLDHLQSNRAAILNLMAAAPRDGRLARTLAIAQWQAMGQMLDVAGLGSAPCPQVKIAGLSSIYAAVLLRWQRDESPDMAKTMALLDRLLRSAHKAMEFLGRNPVQNP